MPSRSPSRTDAFGRAPPREPEPAASSSFTAARSSTAVVDHGVRRAQQPRQGDQARHVGPGAQVRPVVGRGRTSARPGGSRRRPRAGRRPRGPWPPPARPGGAWARSRLAMRLRPQRSGALSANAPGSPPVTWCRVWSRARSGLSPYAPGAAVHAWVVGQRRRDDAPALADVGGGRRLTGRAPPSTLTRSRVDGAEVTGAPARAAPPRPAHGRGRCRRGRGRPPRGRAGPARARPGGTRRDRRPGPPCSRRRRVVRLTAARSATCSAVRFCSLRQVTRWRPISVRPRCTRTGSSCRAMVAPYGQRARKR